MIYRVVLLAASLAGAVALASDFPVEVTSYSGLGGGIYSSPAAVLGRPSTWVRDTVLGGINQRNLVNPGYGAWSVDPAGNPLITTILPGGHITVRFDPPLTDDSAHWFGKEFTVFGNSFFTTTVPVSSSAQLETIRVVGTTDFVEPMQVSVSPDGFQWFSYPLTSFTAADGMWPSTAIAWDATNQTTRGIADIFRPVSPSLTRPNLQNLSLAEVLRRYEGSAGGTSFDLADTPFRQVQFVRIDGSGGEVDAIVRVGNARDRERR